MIEIAEEKLKKQGEILECVVCNVWKSMFAAQKRIILACEPQLFCLEAWKRELKD